MAAKPVASVTPRAGPGRLRNRGLSCDRLTIGLAVGVSLLVIVPMAIGLHWMISHHRETGIVPEWNDSVSIRWCPAHQRRGLGTWIVQRMAARARALGLVPTAGCGIENAVSRRTLERAGFVADHRLLQFVR